MFSQFSRKKKNTRPKPQTSTNSFRQVKICDGLIKYNMIIEKQEFETQIQATG